MEEKEQQTLTSSPVPGASSLAVAEELHTSISWLDSGETAALHFVTQGQPYKLGNYTIGKRPRTKSEDSSDTRVVLPNVKRPRYTEEDDQSSNSNICSLPSEILLQIFSWLPAKEIYTSIRLVCTLWHSLSGICCEHFVYLFMLLV
jgi:hypothetical protein